MSPKIKLEGKASPNSIAGQKQMKGISNKNYITPFRESETSQYKSVGGVAQSRTYKQYAGNNPSSTMGNIFNPPQRSTLTKFNALPSDQTNNATEPQVLMI